MINVICKRCGKCCYYYHNRNIKQCKYLKHLSNGKTSCEIYKNRLSIVLDINDDDTIIYCAKRNDNEVNYEGCPYNKKIWTDFKKSI